MMIVVEISLGGGWYIDILVLLLKDNGKLVVVYFFVDDDSLGYYQCLLVVFKDKMVNYVFYSNIELIVFYLVKVLMVVEVGLVDCVLMFRNVYNWYMVVKDDGVLNVMIVFYNVLKFGGMLGVVDYCLLEIVSDDIMEFLGYMK